MTRSNAHASAVSMSEGRMAWSLGPSALALTDSPQSHHDSRPLGRFGIDTIAVSGPVARDVLSRLSGRLIRSFDSRTGEVRDRMTSAKYPGRHGYRVDIQAWRGGEPRARLEFSAPRMLRGDNRRPATASEVETVVRQAYDEVGHDLPWMCDVADLSVERLDIARDFERVVDGPLLLEGLSRVPPLRMGTQTFPSRDHSGTQTLVRETTRHRGQLYCRDLHYRNRAIRARGPERQRLEALAVADHGVVRFELNLWHEQALESGTGTLAALRSAPLGEVGKKFFAERCRFAEVIAGPAWKMKRAAESLVASGAGAAIVTTLGQWVADALGIDGGRHPKTASGYRKGYKDLGLKPADLWLPEREPVRFDWAQGRVVPVGDADSRAA